MRISRILVLGFFLLISFSTIAKATLPNKQLTQLSMENDAQFIECVGNIFLGIADFQRVSLEALKWEPKNIEFMKVSKARESFAKSSKNLTNALMNSDDLLSGLDEQKKVKFEKQLTDFKSQIKDLNLRIQNIINGIDNHTLPSTDEVHRLVGLAINGAGFGMKVSNDNAKNNSSR